MKIDIKRALRGAEQISMEGLPSTHERLKVIEEAIAAIIDDGETALRDEYLGVKNYAHFGDQRHDTRYGYGPSHGSIVFSVGRRDNVERLDKDAIYFLEASRDFSGMEGFWPWHKQQGWGRPYPTMNLGEVLKIRSQLEENLSNIEAHLSECEVETHV